MAASSAFDIPILSSYYSGFNREHVTYAETLVRLSGEWGMGNGEWGMGNGEWGIGNRGSMGSRSIW
ncbi:MAG: hypothetical protein F6K50_49005 [Moorea sp. SIO3I7]|uniref:hypothetical protein n=2 Tax=unclassified Moorena TaxID=2683338 RepID=UPI0013C00180|nr:MULTISPECIES: hypothetical protein [unclassified Moorena]NEO02987.1 hypothetical protein [Moorena sp. SIO3I7]NEO04112.1 hypothetical protein [Moorena sp. SIO3I8]NEP25242.1 hypothetical protein [Moorena sp. SIO3I6]